MISKMIYENQILLQLNAFDNSVVLLSESIFKKCEVIPNWKQGTYETRIGFSNLWAFSKKSKSFLATQAASNRKSAW